MAVKRISRYLVHTPNLGLWYPKGSTFDLLGYSDSDYAGCKVDRKSSSGTCQFLGRSLVSWSSKKTKLRCPFHRRGRVCCSRRLLCSTTVGDSPRGPLKQLGNPHLKPATKPKPNTPYLTMQDMAHATKAPAAHQAAHSKTPSNRFRLARGCVPPSGGLRPVRGGDLARGSAPPLNGVRLARGHSARARLLPYAGI
jgi:hypothetical protein